MFQFQLPFLFSHFHWFCSLFTPFVIYSFSHPYFHYYYFNLACYPDCVPMIIHFKSILISNQEFSIGTLASCLTTKYFINNSLLSFHSYLFPTHWSSDDLIFLFFFHLLSPHSWNFKGMVDFCNPSAFSFFQVFQNPLYLSCYLYSQCNSLVHAVFSIFLKLLPKLIYFHFLRQFRLWYLENMNDFSVTNQIKQNENFTECHLSCQWPDSYLVLSDKTLSVLSFIIFSCIQHSRQ